MTLRPQMEPLDAALAVLSWMADAVHWIGVVGYLVASWALAWACYELANGPVGWPNSVIRRALCSVLAGTAVFAVGAIVVAVRRKR